MHVVRTIRVRVRKVTFQNMNGQAMRYLKSDSPFAFQIGLTQ